MFATQTLSGHLIRGAVAFALIYVAIGQQRAHPVWSMLAGVTALVAMRGCRSATRVRPMTRARATARGARQPAPCSRMRQPRAGTPPIA